MITIFFLSIIGLQVHSDGEINLEELKSKLPAGIELPANLNNITSSLPTLEEFKALVKSKCEKVTGGVAAFVDIEEAATTLQECASDLIDFEVLQQEIEKAQPTGELDTVFNK